METLLNFTNIDKEDFVGMYTGEEIPVKAGRTKPFTETIAKHIAEMLATKILIRDDPDKNYLDDPKREVLIKEMLGEVVAMSPEAEEKEAEKEEEAEEKEEPFADLKKRKRK